MRGVFNKRVKQTVLWILSPNSYVNLKAAVLEGGGGGKLILLLFQSGQFIVQKTALGFLCG